MELKVCKNPECPRAGEGQPYSEFYEHKGMADGHLSFCKHCVKERMKRTRVVHADHYAEYERNRDKDKVNARRRLRNAVKAGKVQKYACWCGNARSQGHHEDYTRPFDVIWLCNRHHAEHEQGYVHPSSRETMDKLGL